jgi:hypothetical protein
MMAKCHGVLPPLKTELLSLKLKRIILIVTFFFIFQSFVHIHAQWIKIYGGNKEDDALLIQQTGDGGWIVAGGTRSFVAGEMSLWILKLNLNGSIEWQNCYSSDYINPLSIQPTGDGGYLVGCNRGSFGGTKMILALKLDSLGRIDGSASRGWSVSDYAQSIQQTSDGGFILTGTNPGWWEEKRNIWVSKLSSSGDIDWEWTFAGNGDDNARSVQQTGDGGYIVAGFTQSFGSGKEDLWILKLDPSGAIEWQRTYGGNENDDACSIQQTRDGGYIVAGFTQSLGAGEEDIWILKLDPSGAIEWQRTYGGNEKDYACSISQTMDGGYIVAGVTYSFGAGEKDFWILKLIPSGDIEWQKTFGTSFEEEANSIEQTNDGGYVISGKIFSFGAGSSDFLVIRLLPNGSIGIPCRFLKDSNAGVLDTFISPVDTDIMPIDRKVISRSVFPDFSCLVSKATVYQLCSEKPLLAIHSTSEGTTDPAPGTYIYDSGAKASIRAIPESKSRFSGWSGDASGMSISITVALDSDKLVIASFIRQYTLTIAAGKGGATDPPPGIYSDDSGKEISIKAIPDKGYKFSAWGGDVSGKSNPVKITLNSDKSILANFVPTGEGEIFRIATCAIATAAYGSPLHPYVKVLQDFRDKYLIPSKLGRSLIQVYYKYSPSVARIIAKSKALKATARISLIPLVVFSYSIVHLGPIMTAVMAVFISVLPIFLIAFWRRKIIKKSKGKMMAKCHGVLPPLKTKLISPGTHSLIPEFRGHIIKYCVPKIPKI